VLRTLIAPGTGIAKWGEPVSISVSEAEDAVYIGYEILTSTRYSARIERVSLEGGSPVFVADGVEPAVSPDGTELAYIQESSGRCQALAPCPPVDVNLPVIVRNLTTGSEHRLPASHSPGVSGLSWSDDDVHLAISDGNGFWVEDTSATAAATSEVSIFPPANSNPSYWSDAVYRGSSGSIGAVAFCPETVSCDQTTEVLSIDPTTQQATLLAHLNFGTRSLSFDSTGQTFAYIGLAPGTALPSPLLMKSCAAAVICIGTIGSKHLTPVDTLLLWHDGTTTKLGSGYVSVALSGTGSNSLTGSVEGVFDGLGNQATHIGGVPSPGDMTLTGSNGTYHAVAGPNGHFSVNVPPGTYHIVGRTPGQSGGVSSCMADVTVLTEIVTHTVVNCVFH
jgi:hypothetical protein